MKKLLVFLSLTLVVCFAVLTAACSSPRTKDTADVAGTYYQHEGNTAEGAKEDRWIKLNDDGTWEMGEMEESETETSHTFKLDGDNIKIYFGNMEMMKGTLKDGELDLQVFYLAAWVNEIFFIDKAE